MGARHGLSIFGSTVLLAFHLTSFSVFRISCRLPHQMVGDRTGPTRIKNVQWP